MDTAELEIFLNVADEGNITKAAERMHLSQPTVSRKIRELEEEIGRRLFNRTNKAVVLTEEGRRFLEDARDILTICRKTVRREEAPQALQGDIYIGSGEIAAFSKLTRCIKEYRSLQPGVCFHILSGNADEIREGVEKGVLDLGLMTRSVDTGACESLEFAGKARWGVLVRKDHPLARRDYVKAEELSEEPLILPENRVYNRELTGLIGDSPRTAATYTLAHNAVLLAAAGLGIMLCFDDPSLLTEELTFLPLSPSRYATPLLIWKKRAEQSEIVRSFLSFLPEIEDIPELR